MDNKLKEKYLNTFGKRFSKKEKQQFQTAITDEFHALGYKSEITSERSKFSKLENIYIGQPKQAKYAYVIPYNTPARVLWFKNKIYPHDGYFNMRKLFLPTYLPMFIGYGFLLAFVYLFPSFISKDVLNIFYPLCFLYLGVLIWFILHGFGNKHNYVNNSSAIALAVQLAENLPENRRKEVMFIFSDGNKPSTALGNPQITKYLQEHNKLNLSLISLYCIGSGNTIELFCDRNTKSIGKELTKTYKGETSLKTRHINDNDKNNTVIEGFPRAMMISSGTYEKDYFMVSDVGTPKDEHIEEFVIDTIYDILIDYMKKKK
ncbi:hypothetical protein M2475_001445 [Breznakia sp. PF5-3]|uniref:hypothetical protein n=1 Tax=unclassified Breznakia TaxID=2623764 RepID=UPI0024059BB7|nr:MULTISPECIES: hypothetical protein [unclassified Breznakia]MDL2276278.1 hypothetical protein [Breznakia sp. OttesenSCG-928-G09]MDF9825564.1 hypothetical protein [Breznakia sp. PM6-1]MDF9835871.1 hypothetical protein [Breznakia sp. PF5-3]MDF9837616.1 hypothetical protein [Breznakia sp. PFB2-8]MDF9860003.1 hypothetical protein [Breznakia sp. PH5-24]